MLQGPTAGEIPLSGTLLLNQKQYSVNNYTHEERVGPPTTFKMLLTN